MKLFGRSKQQQQQQQQQIPSTPPTPTTNDDTNSVPPDQETQQQQRPLTMEERLDSLQVEIDQLNQRNREKDRGKKFESSYTRVLFLMAVTYWTLFLYMKYVLKTAHPFLDALVPTVGFNISTWSLPFVKEWWIQTKHYVEHGESEAITRQRIKDNSEREGDDVETGKLVPASVEVEEPQSSP